MAVNPVTRQFHLAISVVLLMATKVDKTYVARNAFPERSTYTAATNNRLLILLLLFLLFWLIPDADLIDGVARLLWRMQPSSRGHLHACTRHSLNKLLLLLVLY